MKVHHYSKALSWITRPRVTETATAETYTPELERMNFRPFTGKVGGLVEPGVTHYGKRKKLDTWGRPIRYTAKSLTKNQVNMMRKNLPEGVMLIPDYEKKGQWKYKIDISKGKRGSKDFERVHKQLRATPENLDILLELREKTMKELFPNRLTQQEFKRLRLEEWSELTNKAFAEKLNKLGYRTQANNWTGEFSGGTVHNRQLDLGISKEVGKNIEIRKISEVKNIIRNSSGGKDFLQVYSGNEKVLRTRANRILNNERFLKTRGWFPFGTSNEGKLWSSFFRASKGDRIKIVGEFADGNFPRDADGKVDWFKKNKKDIPAWQRIEFVDTEAPKGKQKFKWENLQSQVDDAFGSGFFARSTKGYDLAVMDSQRMWSGQKLGTVLQEKMLMKDLEDSIFKKEGVRRKPTKSEIDKWMRTRKRGYAMTEAHHVEGIQKNPYKVEPAFRYANRQLKDLEKKFLAGNMDKTRFIAEVENLPGGIRYTMPDGTVIGSKSSEASRLAAAGKATNLSKNKAFVNWIKKFPCRKSNGGIVDVDCHIEGMKHEKNLLAKGKGTKEMANKFFEGTKLARKGGNLRTILGIGGVLGDVLFEGAYAAYNFTQGMDAADVWRHSWYSFMDPSMWKDGKYIGWVDDAEKRKMYEIRDEKGNVTGIRKNVKRYYDNADKVEQQLKLFDNITDMETMDVRGYDRTKAVANAKKALSDFHASLGPLGGMERLYKELEDDQPYVDARLEATDVEKVEDKMAAFEKMKAKGMFPEDKEYADRFDKPSHYRKRYEDFLEARGAEKPSYYTTDEKGKRIVNPDFGKPWAYKKTSDTVHDIFGFMSLEEWKQLQAQYPELKDIPYEVAKWGEYKRFLKEPMAGKTIGEATTPADRYALDLMGNIAQAGGISRIAEGGHVKKQGEADWDNYLPDIDDID